MRIPLISSIIDWFYQIDLFYKKEENRRLIPDDYRQTFIKWMDNRTIQELIESLQHVHKNIDQLNQKIQKLDINRSHIILNHININQIHEAAKLLKINTEVAKSILFQEIQKYEEDKKPKELSQVYEILTNIKTSTEWADIYFEQNKEQLRVYSNFNEKDKIYWAKIQAAKDTIKKKDELYNYSIKELFNVDKERYYEIANRIIIVIERIETDLYKIIDILYVFRISQLKTQSKSI